MEVLNQNQRNSAYRRIAALIAGVLTVLTLILFFTYKAYASQGRAEADKLIAVHERSTKLWQAEEQDLENKIRAAEAKLKVCLEGGAANLRLKSCITRLEGKEKRVEDLEKRLESCEGDLNAATGHY